MKKYPSTIILIAAVTLVLTANLRADAQDQSFYHVKLAAVDNVDVLDPQGSTLQAISPFAGIALRGVEYDPGTNIADVEMEIKKNPGRSVFLSPHTISFVADSAKHEIRFRTTPSKRMEFEILRGKGLNQADADLLIRYADPADLGIPAGVNARIFFTRNNVSDLQLDLDGNGSYETVIGPQFRVTGNAAKDEEGPQMTMSASVAGRTATITVSARDSGSGLKNIRYQIGIGNLTHPLYTDPFRVDISQTVWVFAFADDLAGNRAMRYKVFEGGVDTTDKHPWPGPFDPVPAIKNSTDSTDKSLKADPFQLKSKPF